ncbi:MAG: hypothetical protein VR65_06180 [Desulfobulbaceae bacterium BRH_c16a]|nr:MAG: hypothetical protein VR65_06180 [Desulfobulbaceae bacterium BRH_c16a]
MSGAIIETENRDMSRLQRSLGGVEEVLREVKKDFATLERNESADRFRMLATLGMANVRLGEYRDLLQGAIEAGESRTQEKPGRKSFGGLRLVKG